MKRNLQGKTTGPDHLVPLSRQAVELLREPNLRRTHATAATGSVCARPI